MRLLTVLLLALLCMSSVSARLVPAWDFDELMAESTIVALADPTAVRDRPDLDDSLIGQDDREFLTMVETEFTIRFVLKGKHDEKTITVTHAIATKAGEMLGNGPNVPDFQKYLTQPKRVQMQIGGEPISKIVKRASVIIFLKRVDGKNRFVTGVFDSAFSVKLLRDFPAFFPADVTR